MRRLGPLLGVWDALGVLLGLSWGALGSPWAALGVSWGALGASWGRSWGLPGRSWDLPGRSKIDPKIDPKLDSKTNRIATEKNGPNTTPVDVSELDQTRRKSDPIRLEIYRYRF